MPVTSQATLSPTCVCSHCSCCVRMAARLLLRLRMPGRAAALFRLIYCGYTALTWAGYASALQEVDHNLNFGAKWSVKQMWSIGGASAPWINRVGARILEALAPWLAPAKLSAALRGVCMLINSSSQTAGRVGLHWPSRLA